MREKHSLESYYCRSFMCLQIGTNFQCRFKKIGGMWANILFKKVFCFVPAAATVVAVGGWPQETTGFPGSSDSGWRSAWAQHDHCPEGTLALSPLPCPSVSRGNKARRPWWFGPWAVTGCSEDFVSPLSRQGMPFSGDSGHFPPPAHIFSSNYSYAVPKGWEGTGLCAWHCLLSFPNIEPW